MTAPICGACARPMTLGAAHRSGRPRWVCGGAGKRCILGRRVTRHQAAKLGITLPSTTDVERAEHRHAAWAIGRVLKGRPTEASLVGWALNLADAAGAFEALRMLRALTERATARGVAERPADATWGAPGREADVPGADCAWCGSREWEAPARLVGAADARGVVTWTRYESRRTDAVFCARCGGPHRETARGFVPDARGDERLDDDAAAVAA